MRGCGVKVGTCALPINTLLIRPRMTVIIQIGCESLKDTCALVGTHAHW